MTKTTSIIFFTCLLLFSVTAYINPVQSQHDSPDPGVIYNGYTYYAVTTEGWNGNRFPIWQSKDLFNFTQVGWIFTTIPTWATQNFWAPQLHLIGSNYVAYYTARDRTGLLCIGVAYSQYPLGPYIDRGSPLLRNATQGVIDATIYQFSNGTIYLIYKTDGNAHGKPTQIYAIQLSADGRSTVGQNHLLFRDSLPWQQGIVQAPWVIVQNNQFFVFYSSCGYANRCYSVGVAKSSNLLGPYTKHPTPILHTRSPQTTSSWQGPGHCSVVKSLTGSWAIVYHAWPNGQIGKTKRIMLVDKVTFQNGWPVVGNGYPSETTQPDF